MGDPLIGEPLPFEEARCGDDATPPSKAVAKGWLFVDCLCTCIDEGLGRLLPRRCKSPTHMAQGESITFVEVNHGSEVSGTKFRQRRTESCKARAYECR